MPGAQAPNGFQVPAAQTILVFDKVEQILDRQWVH
jgi:hypothetical protein